MSHTPITTTSTEGLRPLGTAAQRSFELVTGTVRARLGREAAAVFGEPVATAHGDRIDWYAPLAGKAMELGGLSAEDQGAVRAQLGQLVAEIRTEAERLADSDDAQDQRLSEALRNAIEVPDESMIFAVRDPQGGLHPVLTHWAWLRDEQQSVRGVLTAMVPKAGAGASARRDGGAGGQAAPVTRSGAGMVWWWLILLGWLLLVLLIAAILYLMIAPCGLKSGRLFFCPPPRDAVSAIPGEQLVLENEIAMLEREVTLLDRSCQPTVPIMPGTAPAAPAPAQPAFPLPGPGPSRPGASAPLDESRLSPQDVGRRIAERGGRQGALNFALSWSSTDDIDLTVMCPTGQVLSHVNRSDCNGIYDLDANVRRADAVMNPIETVVFDEVVQGVYTARAVLKGNRTAGDKPVTLHVLRRDGRGQTYSGRVGDTVPEWSVNISISR